MNGAAHAEYEINRLSDRTVFLRAVIREVYGLATQHTWLGASSASEADGMAINAITNCLEKHGLDDLERRQP